METKSIITEDMTKVYYDHYKHGHDKVIVLAHGFFNSKSAKLLKKLGEALGDRYDVIIIDFRGHGQSGGIFYWTAKEYLDLTAVINVAREEYQRVGLIGFSLGAATSLITAAKADGIDSIIAVSAPTEFEKIEYHFWEIDIENDILYTLIGEGRVGKGVRPGPFWLKKDKPINAVSQIKCPIFFIHGDTDWIIKPQHSQALYDKTKSQKEIAIIKNGPHAEYLIRKNYDEIISLIRKWFQETLN